MSVIRFEGLGKCYGRFRALDSLTADLPGGAMGLLGPNGAGKTTLLKVLLGLLKADEGRAEVLGLDAGRAPLELRRRVGYMPETDCYVPGLTGVRFVALAGELTGLPPRAALTRAHEVLYYVGLREARYRKADEYSQGMRQRLRLAQALVHDPDLLFLDEPTSGLDPDGRTEMLALIRDLTGRQGKHLLLSSHLLPDVEEICARVVVLAGGRIAAEGSLAELRGERRGEYEVRFRGEAAPFLAALAERRIEADPVRPDRLRALLPEGTTPLFAAARTAGVQVRGLAEVTGTLEEAFLEAVRQSEGSG